ncbi:MAG: hypothetical protein EPO39_06585 [Candidatus Manganitrophaceae bacterium]|nr:MAG: hypothetical protein EPO39_06585 [Candidatus Manganitrophaceae bacterium]
MPCGRCSGMMVRDRALDEIGRASHFIWRCVACGDVIDPVILINRTNWPRSQKKLYLRRVVLRLSQDTSSTRSSSRPSS